MPKRQKKKQISDDDQVEDLMAWGNKRQNFYQQGEDEYSQSGEEEQAAQELYDRQFQELGDEELYELPVQAERGDYDDQDQEDQQQNVLSHDYLTAQIARIAKLGLRINEEPASKLKKVLESQIQAYLMALIGLRDLKIAYVEHHPLFTKVIQMKQDIGKLKRLFDTSTVPEEIQEEQEQEADEFQEEAELQGQQSQGEYLQGQEQFDMGESEEDSQKLKRKGKRQTNNNIKEGLKIYEEAKQVHQIKKTAIKEERRMERQANRKPAFIEVKDKEGRLASQRILKNKGLLKKRKKIDRNSRVKHRHKFQKAQSKRKAYGHGMRENPGRQYEGERNIRQGTVKSTRLKR